MFVTDSQDNVIDYALEDVRNVSAVAWNPDGTLIATANTNGTIDIRDASGAILQTIDAHDEIAGSLAWNPNNSNILASGGDDLLIHIWDISELDTPLLIETLQGHRGLIRELDWGINNMLASFGVGETENLRIWDTLTWEQIASPEIGSLNDFLWSSDGRQFVIVGPPDVIAIGSAEDYNPIMIFHADNALPFSLDWHPTENRLISSHLDGSIRLWDIENESPNGMFIQLSEPVKNVRYSFDGTYIVGLQEHVIYVWDANSGQIVEQINVPSTVTFQSIDWSPDGNQIAYGGISLEADGIFEIVDVTSDDE